jgi:hypothetical protein
MPPIRQHYELVHLNFLANISKADLSLFFLCNLLSPPKKENVLNQISRIRFSPDASNKLLIICYAQNRPIKVVNLDKDEITDTLEKQFPMLNEPSESVEVWQLEIEEIADEYQSYIREMNRQDKDSTE